MFSRVLITMMLAGTCYAQESSTFQRTITIPERTPVIIELDQALTSADAKAGTILGFHLVQPLAIDGVTLIAKGEHFSATIVKAKPAGHWKNDGALEFDLGSVSAVDGNPVHLRFPKREPEQKISAGKKTAAVAAAPIVGLIFLYFDPDSVWSIPAASKKGAELVVPAGERFEVYVAEEAKITAAR